MEMRNHWKYLINKNIISAIRSLIPTAMIGVAEPEPKSFFWIILAITICIFFVPILNVHRKYVNISKNLKILPNGIMRNYNLFLFEDVSQIWIFKPASIDNWRFVGRNYNPLSEYFFVELIFKDKTKIFITSLFSDEIDTFLLSKIKNVEVFREDGMFANFPEW